MADETKTQRRTIGEGDDDILPGSRGDTAHIEPFGCVRQCRVCGCLVGGGPTACVRCVRDEERAEREQPASDRWRMLGEDEKIREGDQWENTGRGDWTPLGRGYDGLLVSQVADGSYAGKLRFRRRVEPVQQPATAPASSCPCCAERDEARAEVDRARRLRDGDGRIMDALRRERDEARADMAESRRGWDAAAKERDEARADMLDWQLSSARSEEQLKAALAEVERLRGLVDDACDTASKYRAEAEMLRGEARQLLAAAEQVRNERRW